MQKSLNPSTIPSSVDKSSSGILLWMGRILLFLSAVSLVTMPLTQHLWTWDRFLHGGQDFELGMLAVLVVLSLMLVLSRQSRQSLVLVFARWRILEVNRAKQTRSEHTLPLISSGLQHELQRRLSFGSIAFPIRI